MSTFIIGLSIGTSQTTTALCVLAQRGRDTGEIATYGLPGPANWNDQPTLRHLPDRCMNTSTLCVTSSV